MIAFWELEIKKNVKKKGTENESRKHFEQC